MQLQNMDFNLLMPLRALLEERSVTRAAERMHMSQPALSAALARLRRQFNDELLERRGNTFHLTPLGQLLLDRTYSATLSMERVFMAQGDFDPATSTREYSVFSSDYGMAVLGGAILDILDAVAPHVRVRFHNMTGAIVNAAPDSLRDHDGLLMPHGFLTDHSHLDLFEDRWVCLVGADNDAVGETLTLEDLSDLPWVVTFAGQSEFTPAAKQMQLLGVEPRTKFIGSSFLVLPYLLRGSNRISLVQESLAHQMVASGGLRILELPFDMVPLREAFWWNSVHDRDADHIWFRSILTQAVKSAGLTVPTPTRS